MTNEPLASFDDFAKPTTGRYFKFENVGDFAEGIIEDAKWVPDRFNEGQSVFEIHLMCTDGEVRIITARSYRQQAAIKEAALAAGETKGLVKGAYLKSTFTGYGTAIAGLNAPKNWDVTYVSDSWAPTSVGDAAAEVTVPPEQDPPF